MPAMEAAETRCLYSGTIFFTSGPVLTICVRIALTVQSSVQQSSRHIPSTRYSTRDQSRSPPTAPLTVFYGGPMWAPDGFTLLMQAKFPSCFGTITKRRIPATFSASNVQKYARPIVTNGKVYIGTVNSMVVYGLLQPIPQ